MSEVMCPLKTSKTLHKGDFKEMDSFIDDMISKHSKNAEMMNLMALEATSLATSVESRSASMEEQGFFKRSWRDITGKNHKTSSRNQRDLAQSQYLGQQMLIKLAENNLMTYQMTVALGDKLNRVVDDANSLRLEVADTNQKLAVFFSGLRKQLEQKFTTLERNDDLLFWKETMMFESVYKGKTYSELKKAEKIICLANEFYRHSHQQWSPRDLSFLKSILVQIGHHPDEKIKFKDIFQAYQKDNNLLKQLFIGIDESPELKIVNEMSPTLIAFERLQSFKNEESHLIDTIIHFSPETKKEDAALELTSKHLTNHCGRDLEHEITCFDAIMDLVEDLTFYKQLETVKLNNAKQALDCQEAVQSDDNTPIEITEDDIFNFMEEKKPKLLKITVKNLFQEERVELDVIPKTISYSLIAYRFDEDVNENIEISSLDKSSDIYVTEEVTVNENTSIQRGLKVAHQQCYETSTYLILYVYDFFGNLENSFCGDDIDIENVQEWDMK